MSRTNVTEQELLNWINGELNKDPAAAHCTVAGVQRLRDVTPGDCNWRVGHYQRSVPGQRPPPDGVQPPPDAEQSQAVARVVNDARSRFNVSP